MIRTGARPLPIPPGPRQSRPLRPLLICLVACVTLIGCQRWETKSSSAETTKTNASLSRTSAVEADWFQDRAQAAEIRFQHESGHQEPKYLLPEIMGSGVGLLDFDGDGWLDIYLVQSGRLLTSQDPASANRLFRNLRDGRYQDVTDAAGVGDRGYGMGCCCGDIDGDGDGDLYVTNVGQNTLYRNDGDGTFTDVTDESGTGDTGWSTSASLLDYDQDGHLDLFVANYVQWSPASEKTCELAGQPSYCFPTNYKPAPDTLYRNRGDGTFENVSARAGLHRIYGNGLGVACGDFNQDGHGDIYVANDATPNQLWINQRDGTFRDEALIRGCAVNGQGIAEAGMGVQARDLEQDGDLDLFVTHLRGETNTLYLNRGGDFDDVTNQCGLGAPSVPFTGFGLAFGDFDHDGLDDLFIANGRVTRAAPDDASADPYAEPNLLFVGASHGQFHLRHLSAGNAPVPTTSRGVACGDLDNDGDLDLVVQNRDHAVAILENRVGTAAGHWIQFQVLNSRGSPDVGARVQIVAGGSQWWRTVQPGYSYCSSNDPRIHCGLAGSDRVDAVHVHWSHGGAAGFGPFQANQQYTLSPRDAAAAMIPAVDRKTENKPDGTDRGSRQRYSSPAGRGSHLGSTTSGSVVGRYSW